VLAGRGAPHGKGVTMRSVTMLLATLVVLLAALPAPAPAQDRQGLLVIAHPGVPLASLPAAELQRIYLGKTSRWGDGTNVVPAMLKDGPDQETFVEELLGRPLHRFVTYWRQMVFTGKGVPPHSFGEPSAMVSFVAATPGAVGFARPAAVGDSVKVLRID
jgi:ABC-type phosphate transport system substrate-binding protein